MQETRPDPFTLLDEHVEDNFGEILPHVFFGDLTRFIVSTYERECGIIAF
jgi:hypothetical protein